MFEFYLIIFAVIITFLGFRIVRPVELGVIERFGKYKRTAEQGLRWIIPFVDRMIKINITEIRIDVEKQSVITKDNLNLSIDAVVYFKVEDVHKALYNVNNYYGSIPSLAQTTLRSIIGEMNFTEVNAQRQTINAKIEKELDSQTQAWGINILRVELQDVSPAHDVQAAMDKVVTAEREKEARITQATAEKEAAKQVAEAKVIEARADRQAQIERATGEAEAIRLVNKSAEETFLPKAQKLKAWNVTEKSLAQNSKVIITEKGISPTLVLNESKDKVVPVKK